MNSGTDEIHKLTEAIYKNLAENFNSGVRQILLTGKAYYKSLQVASSAANAYNEALGRVGSAAKICRGGTEEIGEAILQIAEAQKELQARLEDSTKALFTDLILPLEQKLEKDFKKANSDARKYVQGHKVVLSPYNKACESLKKFRKKTKNKLVYDNEKEAQYMRSLGKCQDKLDQFRIQGLKSALLEERRCHCFVLQRLCAVSHLHQAGHRHGVDLYRGLPEWEDISSHPHTLPPSAEQVIADYMHEGFEPMNGGPGFQGNGFLHRDTQSLGNGFMRSQSSQDLYSQYGHFDGSQTLPPRTAGPVPPGDMRVQAVFSFTAGVDNQMSFTDGDIITLMGEKSEGWQYGHNNSTQRMGWFPLSFTKPLSSGRASPDFKPLTPSHRAMSVGERLDSRSLSDYPREYEHDIPGNIRRPKSLYEGSPHTSPAPVLHGLYSERDISPDSVYTSYGRPIQDRSQSTTPVHSRHFSSSQVPIPPPQFHGPPSMSTPAAPVQPFHTRSYTLPTHTSSIPRMTPPSNPAPLPGNNAVPPPPPPPPPPPIPGQSNNTNTKTTPAHTARSIMASPMHKPTSAPQPPVPPPFNPPPGMKHPNAPTSMSHLSQQRSPSSRTSTSGIPGHASPSRQQVSQPPPAPPGEIEETVNYRNNPMFATVALRQTKTNDRSAPKI
ncbi:brain-specific angiogenesis inhibitor 1-associated protein 2-like isoform X2 [Mya arenaria]|uniref:brain-specific angiogenesis inhibitor 1-associated protein 2-like isoform X2 n=1 Tax=Mya arenaria TaxID=6604 RepID=UPI0022E8124B|nr:brain-specific angiogenesis inhibitor 1-associated protein 2-like isoform X2 [Mya arenaria]